MKFEECHICKNTKNIWKKRKHVKITVSFYLPFVCTDCTNVILHYRRSLHSDHVDSLHVKKCKEEAWKKRVEALDMSPDIIWLWKTNGYLNHEMLQRKFMMSCESAKAIVDIIYNA